ncbi:MAG: hypothetical protein PVH63_10880 [Balneolaceae bacterium]|jgi:hypothetical protein
MKKEDKIREQVRKSMQSLDGLHPASTDDLFFERLDKRIQNSSEPENFKFITWFSAAAVAVIFLLLFNVFTIREYQLTFGNQEIARQENLEAFAEEYQSQVEVPTIYELNTQE